MNIFPNSDLLSVGIATAAIGILGFVIYFNNRQSITNRTFLFLSLGAIFYGLFNYINYKVTDPIIVLWLIRLTIFFAVWYAFFLFQFFYVFPKEEIAFSKLYKFGLVPAIICISILNLTPVVFPRLLESPVLGAVSKPEPAFGVIFFGLASLGLIAGAFFFLIKKMYRSKREEKVQYRIIFLGTLLTFPLYLIFNFTFPVFFHNVRFIPLAALFSFPFIAFTAYAIIKHKLLDIKIISTEFLIFSLSIAILFEAIISTTISSLLYRSVVFLLVLGVGVLLIRSVRREVEQREKLAHLSRRLKIANHKLRELDQLKTEFLSVASHQMRTPLSIIKGYTSLLDEGAYGEVTPKAKQILGNIDVSNERLIKLIDEFLDVSRIEQGRTQFAFSRIDVAALAEGVVAELKEKSSTKKVRLALELGRGLNHITADEEKIRHGLYNFVDNAIKYSPNGSTVSVFAEKDDDGVQFRVVDQGVGLDRKDKQNMFQKFYRSGHVAVDIQGTGLGLFVVQQFIESHGGRVWAKSKGLGKGSEFGFWIPREPRGKVYEKWVSEQKVKK